MSLLTFLDLLNGGHDVVPRVLFVPLPLQALGRHIACTQKPRGHWVKTGKISYQPNRFKISQGKHLRKCKQKNCCHVFCKLAATLIPQNHGSGGESLANIRPICMSCYLQCPPSCPCCRRGAATWATCRSFGPDRHRCVAHSPAKINISGNNGQ